MQGCPLDSSMMDWVKGLSSLSISGNLYLKSGLALSPSVAYICRPRRATFHDSCTCGENGERCILQYSFLQL